MFWSTRDSKLPLVSVCVILFDLTPFDCICSIARPAADPAAAIVLGMFSKALKVR